jgi:dTDP-4-amino-4,6-dideoxygalactose transaminase
MSTLALLGGSPLRTAPFAPWPPADEGFRQAVNGVIDRGAWGIGGPMVPQLCETFSAFHDAKFGVACTNGTFALEIALRACQIGTGDEVIVPPYTFIASASAVVSAGAVPVFADVDRDTFNLSPKAVEAAITPLTKGIIAVHIAGMPCDLDALKEIANQHNLKLIEDCAQAHGAEYQGQRIGAQGDCGAFSFQSSKNVCAGEGGIVLTNMQEIWERAWSYANLGRVPDGGWYDHRVFGTNLRMTEFQAAVANYGLELLPGHMDIRDANAMHLRKRLDEIDGIGYQAFPPGATRCAWHLFLFKYDRDRMQGISRNRFVEALAAEGIPVSNGYNPLYREGMFRNAWDRTIPPFAPSVYSGSVDYETTFCPNCEHLCGDGSFWLYQSCLLGSQKDVDDIADAIIKVREHLDDLVE